MDATKEVLLFVATTFVSVGAVAIQSNIVTGASLMLVGCAVYIARGFYKKYLEDKKAE